MGGSVPQPTELTPPRGTPPLCGIPREEADYKITVIDTPSNCPLAHCVQGPTARPLRPASQGPGKFKLERHLRYRVLTVENEVQGSFGPLGHPLPADPFQERP